MVLPRPQRVEAMAATGTRLYSVQALGGGGMPGGSGRSVAQCSKTRAQCYTDGVACPLAPDFTTQICLPVSDGTDGTGKPGNFGLQGTNGLVSCAALGIPTAVTAVGLVCQ